jgi:hypothetical protein
LFLLHRVVIFWLVFLSICSSWVCGWWFWVSHFIFIFSVVVVVMALAVVEKSGLKRMREDVALTHDGGEVDEDGASPPASKCQILDHPPLPLAGSVLDVAVNPRGGSSTCSNECVSAVTGGCGVEEEGPTGSTAVLRELEECLVADDEEQVGSSESSAVSEENAARRVLRSLEQELGLSCESCEKGNQAAVSSINTPSAPPPPTSCAEAFATGSCWADDMWNMHGFSSADLESVGCSTTSGSSLTTGDDDHLAVCDDSQFDILLPMLNHHGSSGNDVVVPVVDMCNNMAATGGGTVSPPVVAVDETLESLENSVSWALEEGFDDYSGFTDIAVEDEEWMTPVVDNLDFLLDSTTAYATTITAPFVEEAAAVGTSLI